MKIGGGWSTLKALVEMALVNGRPQLHEGDRLPGAIALHPLGSRCGEGGAAAGDARALASLCRPGIPLVINFGSCS